MGIASVSANVRNMLYNSQTQLIQSIHISKQLKKLLQFIYIYLHILQAKRRKLTK